MKKTLLLSFLLINLCSTNAQVYIPSNVTADDHGVVIPPNGGGTVEDPKVGSNTCFYWKVNDSISSPMELCIDKINRLRNVVWGLSDIISDLPELVKELDHTNDLRFAKIALVEMKELSCLRFHRYKNYRKCMLE